MAALWNVLRQEVSLTVDDFRQKGPGGVFRDVALDAMDIAKDAGGLLVEGMKHVTGSENAFDVEAYLQGPTMPQPDTSVMLHFLDGTSMEVNVVQVDGTAEPPRAWIKTPTGDADQMLMVPVLDPALVDQAIADGLLGTGGSWSAFLKKEWDSTVQEFREKGAVNTIKDAAFETADMVQDTAASVVNAAKTVAVPAVQDLREKGAMNAAKDAVDLVGNTAKSAISTASTVVNGETARAAVDLASSTASSAMTTATDAINGPRARTAISMAGSTATNAVEVAGAALQNARARAGPLLEQVQTQLPDLWAAPPADATAAGVAAGATAATGGAAATAEGERSATTVGVSDEDPFLAGVSPGGASQEQTQEANSPSAPAAASDASPSPEVPAAATKVAAPPPTQAEGAAAPTPESEMPAAKAPKRGLVSMRSKMFQKPKPDEPKTASEELID